jgi:xanthine dehydrogenase iron-sulfur cluster and FAD-binding subunit A
LAKISDIYPDFSELQRRFASMPIKNAGTLAVILPMVLQLAIQCLL